jgi:hypothetical protein
MKCSRCVCGNARFVECWRHHLALLADNCTVILQETISSVGSMNELRHCVIYLYVLL